MKTRDTHRLITGHHTQHHHQRRPRRPVGKLAWSVAVTALLSTPLAAQAPLPPSQSCSAYINSDGTFLARGHGGSDSLAGIFPCGFNSVQRTSRGVYTVEVSNAFKVNNDSSTSGLLTLCTGTVSNSGPGPSTLKLWGGEPDPSDLASETTYTIRTHGAALGLLPVAADRDFILNCEGQTRIQE